MNRLLCCFRPYQLVHPAVEPGELLENELGDIVLNSQDLALEILKNTELFSTFVKRYEGLKNAPHFEEGNYSVQCGELNKELEQFAERRKAQNQQRAELRHAFKQWLSWHLDPNDAQQQQLIAQFKERIKTSDGLDETNHEWPKMREWTCDYLDEMSCESARCCAWFNICCFPWAFCCNKTCCGLNGKVQQLKYVSQKGIKGPSCCVMI